MLLFNSRSIFSIQFHLLWPTGVELCSCPHSTRTSEASAGYAIHKCDGYPDSARLVLMSMRTQPEGIRLHWSEHRVG